MWRFFEWVVEEGRLVAVLVLGWVVVVMLGWGLELGMAGEEVLLVVASGVEVSWVGERTSGLMAGSSIVVEERRMEERCAFGGLVSVRRRLVGRPVMVSLGWISGESVLGAARRPLVLALRDCILVRRRERVLWQFLTVYQRVFIEVRRSRQACMSLESGQCTEVEGGEECDSRTSSSFGILAELASESYDETTHPGG